MFYLIRFSIFLALTCAASVEDPTDGCELSAYPPHVLSGCCGVESKTSQRSRRAVGALITAPRQHPWLALLLLNENYNKDFCSGFLISAKYVVSGISCVDQPKNFVRLGEYDTSNENKDCVDLPSGRECTDGALTIAIEKIIRHQQENGDSSNICYTHDIALIRLQKTAPYTDFIRPVCLPSADVTAIPPESLVFKYAGWGAVHQTYNPHTQKYKNHFGDERSEVDLPYVPLETCKTYYNRANFEVFFRHKVCAGGIGGKDKCQGDNGGPLLYKNRDDVYEVVGIIGCGAPSPCGQENRPTITTKVYPKVGWIHRNIRSIIGDDIKAVIAEYSNLAKDNTELNLDESIKV